MFNSAKEAWDSYGATTRVLVIVGVAAILGALIHFGVDPLQDYAGLNQ